MFLGRSEAVDEGSGIKCENGNQKSLDPSEIWNIIAFNFRSPSGDSFSLSPQSELFQSDKEEGLLSVQI